MRLGPLLLLGILAFATAGGATVPLDADLQVTGLGGLAPGGVDSHTLSHLCREVLGDYICDLLGL